MRSAASFISTLSIALGACVGGQAASRDARPSPELAPDEMGIVVENAGPVDVEAWISFFGGAERRIGLVPAGTEQAFPVRYVSQDFSLLLVVARSRVLGTSGQVVGSPLVDGATVGDVYYVHVPANGPIVYAKNGPPQLPDAGTGGGVGVKTLLPTVIVAVGLVFLIRALLNLEVN